MIDKLRCSVVLTSKEVELLRQMVESEFDRVLAEEAPGDVRLYHAVKRKVVQADESINGPFED